MNGRSFATSLCLIGSLSSCSTTSREPASRDVPAPPQVLHSGSETAEYSYATGCLRAYYRICQRFAKEEGRAACNDTGLAECEKDAHDFGEWIRHSPSKPGAKP